MRATSSVQRPRSEMGVLSSRARDLALSRRRGARLASAVLGLVVIAGGYPVLAQEHPPERRRLVNIVVAGDATVGDRVLAVIRDSLARQGVDVSTTVVPRLDPLRQVRAPAETSPTGPVVHLWLDLGARQPAMYLVSATSRLVYVRPLAVGATPDAVEIELIRFVVDSSVRAILQGRSLGISRDQFEQSLKAESTSGTAGAATPDTTSRTEDVQAAPLSPPTPNANAPTPLPPPKASPRPAEQPPEARPQAPPTTEGSPLEAPTPADHRWSISGAYSGTMLASDFVEHGPQLTLELRRRGLYLGIAMMQTFPLAVDRDDVRTRLTSSGARIFAALPVALGSAWTASLGLGAGLDVTHVAPEGTGATSSFWVSDPLMRARAVIERAFAGMFAAAELGIDWDFVAAHYAVTRSEGTVTAWTPQRWRPYAALALGLLF